MDRRTYLGILGRAGLAAGTLGAPFIARAQDKRKLRFCSNASAVSKVWQTAYAAPFTKATGSEIAFTDVPNTAAAVMGSRGTGTYDLAYSTYGDVLTLAKQDALETFSPNDFPRLKNIPARYQLRDASGRVIGIGAYMAWYGVTYNTTMAKASDFQSWRDLTHAKWKDKLALNRPMWTALYDLTILSKATGGTDANAEPAIPLFRAIAKNALISYTSNSHMAQLLTRGEIAAGVYYSHRTFNLQREGHRNLAFAVPKEGALALPYAIAVPKGTKNREAVKEFLNFMMTPEPMHLMSTLDPVISMDPTIKFTPEQVKEVGMDYDTLLSKIYMPDWAVLEQHWKERTALCEQIFATKT